MVQIILCMFSSEEDIEINSVFFFNETLLFLIFFFFFLDTRLLRRIQLAA